MASNIFNLIAMVLGKKPTEHNYIEFLNIPDVVEKDGISLISYYIDNQNLVSDKLKKYVASTPQQAKISKNWDEYIQKLEQALSSVKYRKEHNYEQQTIMPTQQELLALQQECQLLTDNWYGDNNGNISCFYGYFIAMSQAAGVTAFRYDEIAKSISYDHYVSKVNAEQRKNYYIKYQENNEEFIAQGGFNVKGKSVIDKGISNNIFFYKTARQLIYHNYAKKIIVADLNLEDYGQLPYLQRVKLWQLIQENYPCDTKEDQQNIFYQYACSIRENSDEYFNTLMQKFPDIYGITRQKMHDIIKIAGLQSGNLILIDSAQVDSWVPKRHLDISWHRKYPLENIRQPGTLEQARLLPNSIPYMLVHGLSVCADGLIDNIPRDIEKLFREFKLLCPQIKYKETLQNEMLISIFQSPVAYSTIHATQHTQISNSTIQQFNLYNNLVGDKFYLANMDVNVELVQIGNLIDAMYLKIYFNNLDNEKLIQFILQLNQDIFLYFGGEKGLDVYIHMFITQDGKYVFIYQPCAYLIPIENDKFLNPENNIITSRRPQFLQPHVGDISYFTNEMAAGLEYCRKFFDDTSKLGVYKFINDYIAKYINS